MNHPLESLPDPELLERTQGLVRCGRAVEAELLRHLGEVDARKLYLGEACASMFVYCVRVLHFSEAAAYRRIRAARATRRHPQLLPALRRGELHVTAVSLLAAQLTGESCGEWIRVARHKTAEEIKRLLADRQPKPDVADCVRRIPASVSSGNTATATERAEIPDLKADEAGRKPALVSEAENTPTGVAPREPSHAQTSPLGGERYRVCFTAGAELHAQLQELRALMRHQVPDGDLGSLLGRAVALLLERVRKRKFGAGAGARSIQASSSSDPSSRKPSRHIPAAIRRAVVRRDAGRCRYVSPAGVRCAAAEFLEFHHVDPWARTRTHSVDGIALRCRAHNQYEAGRVFGEEHMARFRKREGSGEGFSRARRSTESR
ncbi:MAG: hypothetical protein V3T01_12505 [Myxococcota bacterium]